MKPLERELIHCVAIGKTGKLTELLSHPSANSNLKDEAGSSLLHLAALNNREKVVGILLDAGAKANTRDKSRGTPLTLFLEQSRAKTDTIALMLVRAGAKVDQKRTPRAWSALHWAVFRGWNSLVGELLRHGGDVDESENTDRWSPLHFARSNEVGRLLIDAGAHVNAIDKEGLSPLEHVLSRLDSPANGVDPSELRALSETLVAAGADCNKVAPDGTSVLMRAIQVGAVNLSLTMIEKGADVTYVNPRTGAGVAHVAASADGRVLEGALKRGADPGLRMSGGSTPLHHASANGCRENIALLLDKGADPAVMDDVGRTAADYAAEGLLIRRGAQR